MTGTRLNTTEYRAPLWLPGGHAQTIWPVTRGGPLPRYLRERWDTPDDDFIDLDWAESKPSRGSIQPLVVLFHGLEGSSRSHYARALIHALKPRNWHGVVSHFRGCSGEMNRLARAYHSGDSAEIDWILRRLRANHPHNPIFAIGISLGGNALLKWLGEQEQEALKVIDSAAAVCPPLDLTAAGQALERGFNRVYTDRFLLTLKRNAQERLLKFPALFDPILVRRARTLRDFDDAVTAPLHGFRDAADYWKRASSKPWLRSIQVPTLLLSALNDPFMPANALPAATEVSKHVQLEYPREGGHVGFPNGPFPGHVSWLPDRLISYFSYQ